MAPTATIPKPRGLPLIGNLADLNSQTPVQSLMALARVHGPIFRISAFGDGMTIVSSQELVNEICDDKRFEKGVHPALKQLRDVGGDGLFTAYTGEANWG